MKLAICFYGQPRQLETWHSNNQRLYEGCEYDHYIHMWGDQAIKEKVNSLYSPVACIVEPQADIPTDLDYPVNTAYITKSIFITLSPLYSMYRLGMLIEKSSADYDYWILTRPDVCAQGFKLRDFIGENNLYTSFVPGPEWLTSAVDTKFICGTKEDILNLTDIYKNLPKYCGIDKTPLCHHRLFHHVLKDRMSTARMIKGDSRHWSGGWFWVRDNNVLKLS
tara:strand:- start:842 stop:1507 length:666 start_codon:yes stop_codon:yes gene_type:complete